jgi:hypothetical protein
MTLELPRARHEDGALVANVIYVDRFGNVQLSAGHEDLGAAGLRLGRPVVIEREDEEPLQGTYVRTFADVPAGRLLAYEDSSRRLSLAVSHGSAAGVLRLRVDDELRIRPA